MGFHAIASDVTDSDNFLTNTKCARLLDDNWTMQILIIGANGRVGFEDRAQSEPLMADAVIHPAVKALASMDKQINALLIHFSTDCVDPGKNSQGLAEFSQTPF